jgi:hypothetical protein
VTSTIQVTGHSDDLIEIDGAISEEWAADADGNLLAFSDGTVLQIVYSKDGIWRITLVAQGSAQVQIVQCPAVNDDREYTDRATLTGPISWVVLGTACGRRWRRRSSVAHTK